MGASLPYLKAGNVGLQVMAVYTDVVEGSTQHALKQVTQFSNLFKKNEFHAISNNKLLEFKPQAIIAIENVSGLCEEDMKLEQAFSNLEYILKLVKNILYISLTHHKENRFGGGNYSNIGLKHDGEVFLEFMNEKQIAVDLAHTSDALAYDIINFIDKKGLEIPVIASHSNFRKKFNHVRNLPDDLVDEIVKRKGVIGINFLRAYLHHENPEKLYEHILYGFEKAADALCFGADFFYTEDYPDSSRQPFYFPIHENASKYPSIISKLKEMGIEEEYVRKLAYKNAAEFIQREII